MDIKKNRRDAAKMGQVWDKTLPMVEGMYPADNGSSAGSKTKGHGNAGSDNNIGWDVRAQSWQRGADTDFTAIEAEKIENDKRFGVPHEDSFPAPSDPAGPKNCGARYQTASYDANDTLPSPSNFSNNPGFMSTSASSAATSGAPAMRGGGSPEIRGSLRPASSLGGGRQTSGGSSGRAGTVGGSTIGRSASLGARNVTMPAPGDTDPGQEGGPQIVSSGYSG